MEITPELAEVCGIHAGDGYLRVRERNKGEVDISGSFEEKNYYDDHVIPLFSNAFGLKLIGRYFSRKTYGFVCYDGKPREFLLEAGFPSGKKSAIVQIPKAILESNDKILFCRFLRGLFDTDGNLYFRKSYAGIDNFKIRYNHYPIIKLSTISKFLAEGVIKILHFIDINFHYYSQDSKKLNEKRSYHITISGKDGLENWMKLVGTKNKVHLSRYLIWKKLGFCPPRLSLKEREDILKGKLDPNIGPVM